jgi:hypothetical protein
MTCKDCNGDVERRFTKDELLTNITLYWVTGTIGSSFLPYYDVMHAGASRWIAEKVKESSSPERFATSSVRIDGDSRTRFVALGTRCGVRP